MRHHMCRHQIATSTFGLIASTLLPSLAALSTTSVIIMQRSSMSDKNDDFGDAQLPDFSQTINQLEKSKQLVSDIIRKLENTDGPIEMFDFTRDINLLGNAKLIGSNSPFLAELEDKGHIAAYKKLLSAINQATDDAVMLSNWSTEDSSKIDLLATIGARTMNTMHSFWDLGAVNIESWLRQKTPLSIITKPAEKQTIAA